MRGIEVCGAVALLAAGVCHPAIAAAQDAAPSTERADDMSGTAAGDIVVTAQKREQALIDVPLSITAVTGAELMRRGATTINDFQFAIPGLSVSEFSPGQQRVQLRGASVYSGLPTVGVYQDELPLNLESNQSGQDVRLFDIARVEVLRGPQGTLYGQGAVGGTIRYITNDVDLTRIEGNAEGEIAGIDSGGTDWRAEGAVNVPLVTDRLGLRIAGTYRHFGGWIDNPRLGQRNINDGYSYAIRGKLAMQLGEDLRVTLTAQHQDLNVGAQNLSDAAQLAPATTDLPYTSRVTMANGTATYDMGGVTLVSSTSFLHRDEFTVQDITTALAPFVALLGGVPAASVRAVTLEGNLSYEIFAQELRLSSSPGARFDWTVGGFFRDAKTFAKSRTAVDLIAPATLPPGFVLITSDGTNPHDLRSWAAFGEASYRLAPTLTALVGLRYFEDDRVQEAVSNTFGFAVTNTGRRTFRALSPRFNLSWAPGDGVNIYANVARGFRSGGFNLTNGANVPPSFRPDSLWSYEVGGKFQSPDRRLAVEAAVFRTEWSDVQTTTRTPPLPTSYTVNSGRITGWGADGSISYRPVDAIMLTATAGWNSLAYRTNTLDHLDGDRTDYAPRFTGSVSGEYRVALGSLPAFARVDYQYSGRYQVFLRNFQTAPVFSDEQNIVNLRLGVDTGAWNAAVFARNMLNRDSIIYPAFGVLIYPARIQPRTIGVAAGVRF